MYPNEPISYLPNLFLLQYSMSVNPALPGGLHQETWSHPSQNDFRYITVLSMFYSSCLITSRASQLSYNT